MAPLTSLELKTCGEDLNDSDRVDFEGKWNEQWTIFNSVFGGYSLSLCIQAAQKWIRLTSKRSYSQEPDQLHTDPLHVSATFLTALTTKRPFRIEIRAVKRGRSVTHVEARICQPSPKDGKWQASALALIIMNNFASRYGEAPPITGGSLTPDDSRSYRCPLAHPNSSALQWDPGFKSRRFEFRERVETWGDTLLNAEYEERSKNGRGFGHGSWFALSPEGEQNHLKKGKEEGIGYNWMGVAADMMWNTQILTGIHGRGVNDLWFPTMSMSIEFKRRIPPDVLLTRWGHVSNGRFLDKGQAETDVEIWSHPRDNELLYPPMKEEDGPQILVLARQMGLTVDASRQLSASDKAKPQAKKGGESSSKL